MADTWTVKRNGHKSGLADWWTVYRNGNAVYHFETRDQAVEYVQMQGGAVIDA